MPRVIEADTAEACELGNLIEALETGAFDPEDEDSIASFAPELRRLANNPRFLGDVALEELKQQCRGQIERNHYSAQVILLHTSPKKFALRANFWPAEADSVVVNSGTDPFFYGLPHDHNFSFLTVGYLGPGYWSDYYEYEYEDVLGYTGEKVDLRFVERSRLSPGKVMLYRKLRDIHRQLPPDSLSVSLNILAISGVNDHFDQYRFDIERSEVSGIINQSALENLVALAARYGGEEGLDLIQSFAKRHPSERIRFAALKAQAALEPDVDARIAAYGRAAADTGGFVRAMAEREARRLAESRGQLERSAA
ncbi:MAG: transposase [Allosphingosinicella sp.]